MMINIKDCTDTLSPEEFRSFKKKIRILFGGKGVLNGVLVGNPNLSR
jgi:hypothetical protein